MSSFIGEEKRRLRELLVLKEAEIELRDGLPHLHGFPWYEWSRDFFETKNKQAFLTAGNQLSKSSTMIRKCIDWATDKGKWQELWPKVSRPNLFLYFYPSNSQASIERETKWSQFLPMGKFEEHPIYGHKTEYKNGDVYAIHFNSGVSIFFKSYKQGKAALQTATAYAIFLDEECPVELWGELSFRVAATDGYINSCFTATLGQEFWRRVMEPRDRDDELLPLAWKRQVSAYDCLEYEDGSPTPWTEERINKLMLTCSSPQEVQKRIFGKFVKEGGLICSQFSVKEHVKAWHVVPSNWLWYVAADVGSGKDSDSTHGHPSGVVIVAVAPTFRKGRVVECWRGDGVRTTAGDVYLKAENMVKDLGIVPMAKVYDWGCADFGTISARNGGGWIPAKKGHAAGEETLNVLFKNDMLAVYDRGENGKLVGELCSLAHSTPKNKRHDDLFDPLRYVCLQIPWDWSAIQARRADGVGDEEEKKDSLSDIQRRRGEVEDGRAAEEARLQEEFEEVQGMYDG